jgi:glycosyltransferase involved in cell wall biosynthesis
MRILYDGYIYKLQENGGINRYFNEIISRLPEYVRPCIYGNHPVMALRPKNKTIKYLHGLPKILMPLGNYLWSRYNLFHPTYYHLTAPIDYSRIKTRCVVTVHDFVMSKYADQYHKSQKVITAQEEAIKRADYIICVSESTRQDLLLRYPECEDRSSVTHLASSLSMPKKPTQRPHPKPYCLYVGSRVFYKNFRWALDSISILKRQGLDVDLVVVGTPWTTEEMSLIRNISSENIRLYVQPNDSLLAALYKHALALIYPSNYEGFGLPPLEALSMGCPVIAQRSSSIPEVVGDAGILMDPDAASAELIAESVGSLYTDSAKRDEICAKASLRSREFSWETTAQKTLVAYHKALA